MGRFVVLIILFLFFIFRFLYLCEDESPIASCFFCIIIILYSFFNFYVIFNIFIFLISFLYLLIFVQLLLNQNLLNLLLQVIHHQNYYFFNSFWLLSFCLNQLHNLLIAFLEVLFISILSYKFVEH